MVAKALADAKQGYVGHDVLHVENGERGTILDVMVDAVSGLRYETQFVLLGCKASFWCKHDELFLVAKEGERGSGLTAQALIKAPKNALYLVPHGSSMYYTRRLAEHLNRPDIWITVVENWHQLQGSRGHILFDHHCFERHGPQFTRDLDRALEIARYQNGRFE